MISAIVLAAVLPVAAPSPAPSATPVLQTIASIRSSSRCAQIITHANSAIGAALSNDALLAQTITFMRATNLDDGNAIHRRKGLNALGDMAKTLMQQARSGDDEVKRLRTLAKQTKDPEQAKQLKDFADELGGALWHQQTVARDLNGFLAYVDFKDMTAWDDSQKQMNIATVGVADPQAEPIPPTLPGTGRAIEPPAFIGHEPNEATATEYAQNAARDFSQRLGDILGDERSAAGHVDGAFAECR